MASEIVELKKLRDRGTISSREFQMAKMTVIQRYQPALDPELTNPSATQLAEYPVRLEMEEVRR